MCDLFVLLDGKSYYNRNELILSLGLQHTDIDDEEIYSKREDKSDLFACFTKDIDDFISEVETSAVPYKISGVCHLTFYPPDMTEQLLYSVIQFNDDLFVVGDHNDILNICDYKKIIKRKKTYPYT